MLAKINGGGYYVIGIFVNFEIVQPFWLDKQSER